MNLYIYIHIQKSKGSFHFNGTLLKFCSYSGCGRFSFSPRSNIKLVSTYYKLSNLCVHIIRLVGIKSINPYHPTYSTVKRDTYIELERDMKAVCSVTRLLLPMLTNLYHI